MATTGTKSVKTGYRLSPNEEAALIKQEKERRRKIRIQQVREQERHFASKIRNNVSKKKGEELKNLALHLKKDWEEAKKEKTDALQKMFERSLESVGDGHRAASSQPPLAEIRAAQALKDKHAANERYSSALQRQKQEDEQHYLKENAHIIARKAAIQTEKVRAAKIASLPPPAKDPIEDLDDVGKENKVVTVVSGFSTSHYHLKGEYVEKAEPREQEDARLAAQEEERRAKEDEMATEREEKERLEKARLRHQHARKQELLHQDYTRLMEELGQMEQADRRRRQAIVANIPHQVFQPPHKRLEDKQEEQQKLEQAFEDMYMTNTDYTGDLILALEPKPKRDTDLDVTIDSVSDDAGILLQPVPMPPTKREDEGKRFPRGLDEEAGKVAERTIKEDQPKQPRAPLKMLMDRIKSQREELKKKVVLAVPSQEGLPVEEPDTPPSSRDLPSQGASPSQDAPQSPEASQDESGSEKSTLDTLETGTLSEDTNKQEEKMMLLHPMEEAAKIRSASKVPNVELQKKVQQDIMAKEDEQRLRLAEKQLQDHTDHRDHLQMLQDNLLQRQRMLQQQIGEQERLHREQLQLQKQEFEQQRAGLWRDDAPQQPSIKQQRTEPKQQQQQPLDDNMQQQRDIPQQNQGPQTQSHSHAIQRLIRQLQISDQQRQQQRAQQQQLTQHAGQQHDLTQYQELPDNLLQQPQQQVEVPSVSADVQLPWQRPSRQQVEQEHPTRDVPAKPIHQWMDPFTVHKLPSSLEQTGEPRQPQSSPPKVANFQSGVGGYQIPMTVQQGHSKEWLEKFTLDTQRSSQLPPDQARTQPPSRDTLQEAQVRLQQRRERIMQQYPELKLPPYEPYFKDTTTTSSTEPLKDIKTHTLAYPGVFTDAELGKLPDAEQLVSSISGGLPTSADVSATTEVSTATGVSTTGVTLMPTSISASRPDATTSQSDVLQQSASSPGTGPALHEMERQLEQHRQQLLKTRQQLQQQQQQQQQRILDKQRVLTQRIEQQRQEQLARQSGKGTMSQPETQEVLASGLATSQSIPQNMTSKIPEGAPRDTFSGGTMSQPLLQYVMTSPPGTPEVMMSYSDAQPKMMSGHLGVFGELEAEQTKASEVHPSGTLSQQIGQRLSESGTEDTSDKEMPSISQGIYKLPSMTLGQTTYPLDPTGKSTDSEQPSFHELSPDSSANLTESSDHHPAEIASTPEDVRSFHGQSSQYDWATILASNTDPSKPVPVQSTLPSSLRSHRHTRPPPAQWRLPQPVVEAGPHELSTILEAESPRRKRLSRSHPELDPLASTPHKTSPPRIGTSQQDTEASEGPFHLSDKASDMATTTSQVSGRDLVKTLHAAETVQKPVKYSHSPGQADTSTSTTVPSFAVDVGHGVLSYPSSNLMTMGLTTPVTTATSVSVSTSTITSAPLTSPAVIHIASPATDNEDVSTQPDSSVSALSDHTLTQPQHSLSSSLLSEDSVERFLALSAYESSGSESISSTSARYQVRMLGSDKRSSKSPIFKDFVTDIPPGSSWQPSLPPATVTAEGAIHSLPTVPRQSMESAEYTLGPVSPQSIWTESDTQSGSYLAGGVPAFPVFRRSDIPKDGMPMFSDVSLSHYNTSLESGPSVLPPSTTDPGYVLSQQAGVVDIGELYRSGFPRGEQEQWFMPHQSLDNSELHLPNRGATLEPSLGKIPGSREISGDTDSRTLESRPDVGEDEAPGVDESSKLSYAGALVEESHDASEAMDDTLQEVMRNIAISESETSKETGIDEDPDLTLVSLNTTLTSSVAPDETNDDAEKERQWTSVELASDSMVSFLHHEEEMSLESPARSGSDQSKTAGTGSQAEAQVENTPDSSTVRSINLQEAFQRHKQSFIRSSQSRQLEVKVHADSHQATAFSQTLDNWKRSRGGRIQRSRKTKTGKSPAKGPLVKGKRSSTGSTPSGHRTSSSDTARSKDRSRISKTITTADRKASEKDMYQRNVRLYGQLEEVQRQKLTQQRQKDYTTNRQRRKEFEQKLQTRLNKLTKQTSKPSS
ncbi:centrosomal protein of 295 kDa-like [Patiria miniata]|uniref:ALMS motif domain-containing protein n=1 Tax=Patiria miniata TaxID=46514 RepID=A0A913ZEV1_PATMI|nr:centrosomal protein of 295 kDa-like [Patiria miniata]